MWTRFVAFVALILVCSAALLVAQNGNDLFQQGLDKERGSGDIPAAIKIYERIVKDFPSNHALVAKTLIQLGGCYEKTGQAKAQDFYRQVISKYPEQTEMVKLAQTHLVGTSATPLEIATPYSGDLYSFAISPNGHAVVFQASTGGGSQLWLKSLDAGNRVTAIPGTESTLGSMYPFWSPNGLHIGFFANYKLKRVDIDGRNLMELADAPSPYGATWGSRGIIVYAPVFAGPLRRISENGGPSSPASRITQYPSHWYPQFSPDGTHFIYFAVNGGSANQAIGSIDNLEQQRLPLAQGEAQAASFARSDLLMYMANGSLFAQRLDPQSMATVGTSPNLVLDHVAVDRSRPGLAAFSVSASGAIAFRTRGEVARQFAWRDRSGTETGLLGGPDSQSPGTARISPDGQTIAMWRLSGGGAGGVFTMGVTDNFTVEFFGAAGRPIWSPAGDSVAIYNVYPGGDPHPNLYLAPFPYKGSGGKWIAKSPDNLYPNDWSRDGRYLIYLDVSPITARDLKILPFAGGEPIDGAEPIVVAATDADELNARFSPDSQWLVYQSAPLGGKYEVYVQRFPGTLNSRRQVSIDGGTRPEWSTDGREIYYLSQDFHLMTAAITRSGNDLQPGTPRPLFQAPLPAGAEFAVHPDGKRFLINAPVGGAAPPISVLMNWASKLPASPQASAPVVPLPNAATREPK